MSNIDITEIKTRYTMCELLERLGIEVDRKNFICCPFHSEDTPSCRIYEYSYYCFGCGVGGDIIDFVRRYLNKSFAEAIKYLGGERVSFVEQRRIKNRRREYNAAEKARSERDEKYNVLMDEWVRLDKLRTEYAPTDENEPLNPLFVEAITNIARVENELDGLN